MNFEHVDRASVKKLVNIQELKDGHFEIKQVQWNTAMLKMDLSRAFVSVPFFPVNPAEYYVAGKAIDDFIYAEYDQDTVDKWEGEDVVPPTLEQDILKKYPQTFKPHLNTIQKVLQNKYCKYYKLSHELPQYPGLKVFLWSGHEVKNPFKVDRSIYYNIAILRGRNRDIDAFMKNYGM